MEKQNSFVAPPGWACGNESPATGDYCVRGNRKQFEWSKQECLWAFVPADGYEGLVRGVEIADRAIAVVAKLDNTENMSPERQAICPFDGDFFAVCQSLSNILVTPDAVYEEDLLSGEIKKVTPEPVELPVWAMVEFQTRFALQFGAWTTFERENGMNVKVEEPAFLSISDIRRHF